MKDGSPSFPGKSEMSQAAAKAQDSTLAMFTRGLAESDPAIDAVLKGELHRQREQIELIASENIVSRAVLEAAGGVESNQIIARVVRDGVHGWSSGSARERRSLVKARRRRDLTVPSGNPRRSARCLALARSSGGNEMLCVTNVRPLSWGMMQAGACRLGRQRKDGNLVDSY